VDKEKIVDRIRKLLALAQSNNEHEAASAAANAQRLLSEHNLSMDQVSWKRKRQREVHPRAATVPACSLDHPVVRLVAEAFDCRGLQEPCQKRGLFVGVGADPKVAAFTFDYLERALKKLSSSFMKKIPACVEGRGRIKTSYLMGAVLKIHKRLQEQKQKTPVTPGALVPMKKSAIENALSSLLIGKTKTASIGPLQSDAEQIAYSLGYIEGGKIPLRQGVDRGMPPKRLPVR
jgi:hypothetical protein